MQEQEQIEQVMTARQITAEFAKLQKRFNKGEISSAVYLGAALALATPQEKCEGSHKETHKWTRIRPSTI